MWLENEELHVHTHKYTHQKPVSLAVQYTRCSTRFTLFKMVNIYYFIALCTMNRKLNSTVMCVLVDIRSS